jgi:O-methyltransferase involved in polyketide biosynthesis
MMLLARHRQIDDLLARAVERGEVRQVIEIAAGFSARGWRFMQRYGDRGLRYLEGDLPPQAAEKRRILDAAGLRRAGHDVLPLDALVDDGDGSLDAIVRARLDRAQGCAIITEGLVGYFDRQTVTALWRRIAGVLRQFPRGLYLSDINIGDDMRGQYAAETFRIALQAFARGRVHFHFAGAGELEASLRECGFSTVTLHRPGNHLVRVIEAG